MHRVLIVSLFSGSPSTAPFVPSFKSCRFLKAPGCAPGAALAGSRPRVAAWALRGVSTALALLWGLFRMNTARDGIQAGWNGKGWKNESFLPSCSSSTLGGHLGKDWPQNLDLLFALNRNVKFLLVFFSSVKLLNIFPKRRKIISSTAVYLQFWLLIPPPSAFFCILN